MTIIEEFLDRYSREFDAYAEAARLVQVICEENLLENGIRAIVSSRAKRSDRLRDKVLERNKSKKYGSVDQIYKDIVDLAGVRIALYFPGDIDEVHKIIKGRFKILRSKTFPEKRLKSKTHSTDYQKRFSGYSARHYRLSLKSSDLAPDKKRYSKLPVEVQVASVLMHGWAEVEHDLAYKPLSGILSEDEWAILDELNGLVLAGEISLERLQRAVKVRVRRRNERFQNHYELATYIFDRVRKLIPEPVMGRLDVLLRFLQLISKDRPKEIDQYLEDLDKDTEQRPVVDQLVDRIVRTNRQSYEKYAQARREVGERNPYQSFPRLDTDKSDQIALGQFLTKWRQLEAFMLRTHRSKSPTTKFLHVAWPALMKSISLTHKQELIQLRHLRNEVVHGTRSVDQEELASATEKISQLLSDLSKGAT